MEKRERINLVFFAALCAGLLGSAASCKKDGGDNAAPVTGTAFTATAESHKGDGKTYLKDYKVLWEPNDEIAVYNKGNALGLFQAETGGEDKTGFKEVVGNVPENFYESPYTAVYPSKNSAGVANTNATLHLPKSQAYKANGFGRDVNPMTAKSDTKTLAFKNACGLLELQLKGVFKVTKIAVESANEEEKLCGDYGFTMNSEGIPTLDINNVTNGDNTVELTCNSGVQLDAQTPKSFYIVIPEGTLDDGFIVTVTFDNEGTESFSAGAYDPATGHNAHRIARSQIRKMPAKYASMGALPGEFSVSPDTKVHFSKGNLQYVMPTGTSTEGTWRFAEDQWETVERNGDENVSENYANQPVVGLFGWAANGNMSATGAQLPNTTSTITTYGPTLDQYENFSSEYDWGYNEISNGGNKGNLWRVLQCYDGNATASEWEYLINGRRTAANGVTHSYAKVTVAGMRGLMLFPDEFNFENWPINAGLPPEDNYDLSGNSYNSYVYDETQFGLLEELGVVFLPCAGYRIGCSVSNVGSFGIYWSSTILDANNAYRMFFSGDIATDKYNPRYEGRAVRLVCDVE